jgi:2-dehydro-3-deoxyphosphooctonate aldolase (KDO 8-P synthase)
MAKAGVAIGVDGLFIETHFDPKNAKSDGANMLDLEKAEDLISKLARLREVAVELQ